MSDESKAMGAGKVFLFVLAGMAAGAALGAIFAPDEGRKTRSRIAQSAKDFTDYVRDRGEESLNALRKMTISVTPFGSNGPVVSTQSPARSRTRSRSTKTSSREK